MLTAAAGMAGQTDIASVALQELRRAQPNISLAWIGSQMPIKLEVDREHYLEGSVARAWSKYPPAEPGALVMWPLEAAVGAADAAP